MSDIERGLNRYTTRTRPSTFGPVAYAHLPWAILAGVAWGVTFFIPYENPVQFCGFLRATGYPCMFCGLTRSMSAWSQGAWTFALRNAPVTVALYVAMVSVLVWNMAGLLTGTVIRPGYLLKRVRLKWVVIALTALILANWVYRLRMGLT